MNVHHIAALQARLDEQADPHVKTWWESYVKGSAPFRGVKMAAVRSAVHAWYAAGGIGTDLSLAQQKDLALALFREAYTEDKLAGTLFLQEILLPAGAIEWQADLDRFADLFAGGWIYDWNTSDWFCIKVLGPLLEAEGEACARAIAAWRDAENLWQARASVVSFVPVAHDRAYHPLIRASCAVLIRREERFAKTAVGWILREIAALQGHVVRDFIKEHIEHFSLESLRNATKRFDVEEQRAYVQRFRSVHRG